MQCNVHRTGATYICIGGEEGDRVVEAFNLAVCNCGPALPDRLGHIIDLAHCGATVC